MTALWISVAVLTVLIAFVVWRASKLGTVREAIAELLLFLPRP